jgi:hypothetical protein
MHRGRIQSQGSQIEDSESWNDPNPIKAANAIRKTLKLEARHNKREKKLRTYSFEKARKYIRNAKQNGGIDAFYCKSFMAPNDKHRRVDIEVIKGKAFI